jgi:mannitol/fructose-specific phosphotransferase system IIA component (Ntr-type)
VTRVVDIIESGGVLLSPDYSGFPEVVSGLVDCLVDRGRLARGLRDTAIEAVCEREKISSTVMVEIGVSIPHARVEGVEQVIGAMAVHPSGVYYAMAGVPIAIVVLVLSPPDLAGEHLNVLAGLSMLLQSVTVRDGIIRADSEAKVIQLLRDQGARSGT